MSISKNIAIIGAGASGLISAYLLHKTHKVTVFEKQDILGGNVRTLNQNVKGTRLDQNIKVENGVLGFSQAYYPKFHQLLNHLKVPYRSYKPSISLFSDGHYYPARTSSYLNSKVVSDFLSAEYRKNVLGLIPSNKDFTKQVQSSNYKNKTFSDFHFNQELYKAYMQTLFMLSFSTPYALVSQMPQKLINRYYETLPNSTWSFVEGGVYAYMQHILNTANIDVHCGVTDIKITRKDKKVQLNHQGQTSIFDAVIIATTPGAVKHILTDMSEAESKVYNHWEDQRFTTIAHDDLSFYGKYQKVRKTPMDLFYNFKSDAIGYNTYMNTVYGLSTTQPLNFAYGLTSVIDPNKHIHQADHIVPKYHTQHDDRIAQLEAINGEQNTYFAGAYLDNGLHEGATVSALKVSGLLGGMTF